MLQFSNKASILLQFARGNMSQLQIQSESLKAVADLAKQIMTLSTAVLTLTTTVVAFGVSLSPGGRRDIPGVMWGSWLGLVATLVVALLVLAAVTWRLSEIDKSVNQTVQTTINTVTSGTGLTDADKANVSKLLTDAVGRASSGHILPLNPFKNSFSGGCLIMCSLFVVSLGSGVWGACAMLTAS
jgi:hypothetical protein